jgi:hypothetical protein
VAHILCLGSLVNPINARPESRDDVRASARMIADLLELVAKRIRQRASD